MSTVTTTAYEHTQKSPLYLLLAVVSSAMLVSAWFIPQTVVQISLTAAGGIMAMFSMAFRQLSVRDEGESLLVAFGPLSLFRRRVAYSEIERAEQTKSSWLDGWGIHMSPSGGWTWNLWGFDCVDVHLSGGRKLRIGTDDASGLAEFLQQRTMTSVEDGPQPTDDN